MRMSILLLIMLCPFLYACQQQGDHKELITKKIQYDVNIKSPDPDWDWWIQNIVGPDREKLVDLIIDGALSGKFQAYDYFSDSISPEDIKMMLSDTLYLTMKRAVPPYDLFDTTILMNITRDDILRIRFLEEWRIDPETMRFEKKIYGIGPVAYRIDLQGNERWQPLFWIYTDSQYIKQVLENKE